MKPLLLLALVCTQASALTMQEANVSATECLRRIASGYAYLNADLQPQDIADAAVTECQEQVRGMFVPYWESAGKPTGPGVADRLMAEIKAQAKQIALAQAVKVRAALGGRIRATP